MQVEEFFRTGKIHNGVNWVNRSKIEWSYGIPISNEENEKIFKSIDEIVLENKKLIRKK